MTLLERGFTAYLFGKNQKICTISAYHIKLIHNRILGVMINKSQLAKVRKEIESKLKEIGKSKAALSRDLGWSDNSVSQFLSGRSTLSKQNALKMMQAIGASPLGLFELAGGMQLWEVGQNFSGTVQNPTSMVVTNSPKYQVVRIDCPVEIGLIRVCEKSSVSLLCIPVADEANTRARWAITKRTMRSKFKVWSLADYQKEISNGNKFADAKKVVALIWT